MVNFDFDEIEEELDLVVPDIYRMFVDAVIQKGYDLRKHCIYDDTKTLLRGNWEKRLSLGNAEPKWLNHYLDFGVGDGCGNYFFIQATSEADDLVQLWAHDPPGIEEVATGAAFFTSLLAELEQNFDGPERHGFHGSLYWD